MAQQRPIHWVVLADASRAQVFDSDLMLKELMAVEGRVHPASRVPVRELVSGDRGATHAFADGVQSRYDRHSDPHRMALEDFARELAALVRQGRLEGRYERLILIAPPAFLGALRAQLDGESARRVVASLPNDWLGLPAPEIAARLRATLGESQWVPR